MPLNLKTHINIAKDLICWNTQEKDILATKRQNAMKREDFFNLYCSLKMLTILNSLPQVSSYSPTTVLHGSMWCTQVLKGKKLTSRGLMIFCQSKAHPNQQFCSQKQWCSAFFLVDNFISWRMA